MKRLLLTGFISALSLSIALAQNTSCSQTLRLARSIYDQGRLHEIPTLLEKCLSTGFTQQERVEAFKILCLTYLYLEEPEKADDAMLRLLRTDPYFTINKQVDPAEFIALYGTFRTDPIYRLGVNLGVNATQPNVTSSIETCNCESTYNFGVAFQVGINAEIPLSKFSKRLTVNPTLIFARKTFDIESVVSRGVDASGNELTNVTKGVEGQSWLAMPIAVQYKLIDNRFQPYITGGVSADYLLSDEIQIETTQDEAGSIQEKTQDVKAQREPLNISAFAGAGGKLRIFGGYFTAEIRFYYGLVNVNSEETAYKNTELTFNNNLGDSIHKLNSMSVTFGYVQNIFNPKKRIRK